MVDECCILFPLLTEWSKALLLEKWMTNAVHCCEMAGIAPPASALQLVAPTPPMVTPSPPNSVITPPPPPHIPGESMEQEDNLSRETENLVSLTFLLVLPFGFMVMFGFFINCLEKYFHLSFVNFLGSK